MRNSSRMALGVLAFCGAVACGDSGYGPSAGDFGDIPSKELEGAEAPEPWKGFYWVNSNSGPEFSWVIGNVVAEKFVAGPMNGEPLDGAVCEGFGGSVTPGIAARSMHDAIPAGAAFELWMRPKTDEFSGTTGSLGAAAEQKLVWFEQCVRQDWPDAPGVSGFLCVQEDHLGGGANCTSLAAAFEAGVKTPSGATALFGVLAAPQSMARADVDIAMGEMYEPAFFPPSLQCPDPSDGATYGSEIATYLNGQSYGPGAVPAFGGPSSTCPLDYSAFEAAEEGLRGTVTVPLAGIGVWG